jgi:predicted ABC-type ATPase
MNEIEYDYEPSGPEVEKADHYEATFCGSPNCGLHIFSLREDGTIICETTLSEKATLSLVEYCKKHLYQKATKRD